MRRIVRSNVYISKNPMGSVYSATDTEKMSVMLRQIDAWWDGAELKTITREVEYKTDIRILKPGQIWPGNIPVCYTTDQINDNDPSEYMLLGDNGEPVCNIDGNPIYFYYWYASNSKWEPEGELSLDTCLSDLIGHI